VNPASTPLSKRSLLLIGIFLLVLVAGVYSQVFQFGLVEYDDPAFLRDNPYVNDGVTRRGVKWAFFHGDDDAHLLRLGTENLWHPMTWLRSACDLTHWQDSASVLALLDYYIRGQQQNRALEIIGKTMQLKTPNPQNAALLRRYRDQYRGVMQ